MTLADDAHVRHQKESEILNLLSKNLIPIAWEDLDIRGELGRRSRLSFHRMEDYTPEFTLCGNEGWPGDREGRAILGQVLIGQAVHQTSSQTEALLAGLPEGVVGPPLDLGTIQEQQVTGHGWLLRALCEHYRCSGREDMLVRIRHILDALYLPLRGKWRTYPIDPKQRKKDVGAAAGQLTGDVLEGWSLSSDVGGLFLSLDGLTHAYETEPHLELVELVEEGIERFMESDPVSLGCQTHATLSCLRALLRWDRLHGRPELLAHVRSLFDAYLAGAYTEHHHNWNWFGQPSWTEPCAVVDSFQVATELWRATGEVRYLPIAQQILFTGLSRQRHNGGYGCDCCTGANDQTTVAVQDNYEAHWCCTMRGAEGWARAAELCWCLSDERVYLPWQSDSTATLPMHDGVWKVRQESTYPQDGRSVFIVEKAPATGELEVALYVAPWVDRERITGISDWDDNWALVRLPAMIGATIDIELPFGLKQHPGMGEMSASHISFRHGPLLLGVANDPCSKHLGGLPKPLGGARYQATDGSLLGPLGDATWLPEEVCKQSVYKVLFAAEEQP